MRIFAAADFHNRIDRISLIRKAIEQYEPEIAVIPGDITNYFRGDYVLSALNKLSVKILVVRGNTDLRKVDNLVDQNENIRSLHLNVFEYGGFKFIGLNGTIPLPFYSVISLIERRLFKKITSEMGKNTIMVAHPPPRGLLDRVFGRFHAGSYHLRRFLAEAQPILYLCGHIHEDAGIGHVGKTTVVNCSIGRFGKGSLIDVEKDGILKIKML